MSITTEEELVGMQAAGVIARKVLEAKQQVRPGVTTAQLDAIGNRAALNRGLSQVDLVVDLERARLNADGFRKRRHGLVLFDHDKVDSITNELAGEGESRGA